MAIGEAVLARALPAALSSSEAISQKLSWPQTIQVRETGTLYFLAMKSIKGTLYIA